MRGIARNGLLGELAAAALHAGEPRVRYCEMRAAAVVRRRTDLGMSSWPANPGEFVDDQVVEAEMAGVAVFGNKAFVGGYRYASWGAGSLPDRCV
jgi:hypothetical protein